MNGIITYNTFSVAADIVPLIHAVAAVGADRLMPPLITAIVIFPLVSTLFVSTGKASVTLDMYAGIYVTVDALSSADTANSAMLVFITDCAIPYKPMLFRIRFPAAAGINMFILQIILAVPCPLMFMGWGLIAHGTLPVASVSMFHDRGGIAFCAIHPMLAPIDFSIKLPDVFMLLITADGTGIGVSKSMLGSPFFTAAAAGHGVPIGICPYTLPVMDIIAADGTNFLAVGSMRFQSNFLADMAHPLMPTVTSFID